MADIIRASDDVGDRDDFWLFIGDEFAFDAEIGINWIITQPAEILAVGVVLIPNPDEGESAALDDQHANLVSQVEISGMLILVGLHYHGCYRLPFHCDRRSHGSLDGHNTVLQAEGGHTGWYPGSRQNQVVGWIAAEGVAAILEVEEPGQAEPAAIVFRQLAFAFLLFLEDGFCVGILFWTHGANYTTDSIFQQPFLNNFQKCLERYRDCKSPTMRCHLVSVRVVIQLFSIISPGKLGAMNKIHKTLHPEIYHGHGTEPPFFEGWYFKLVSRDGAKRLAVIPGIFLGEGEHAFIQVLDGATRHATYHTFPIAAFKADRRTFDLRIGNNRFTLKGFSLDIDDEQLQIRGAVSFDRIHPWPVTCFSPGIMGWYAWMPRMECYHGVLSFDHQIHGSLTVHGEEIAFENGRGYIEKDWGQAFPEGYIWFQTNHFEQPGICLTASIAIIPWMKNAFRGFIIGFWNNGQLYRFATYTGAKTISLAISDNHIDWVVQDRRYCLEMRIYRVDGGLIYGPTRQNMGKRVDESISAKVDVRLTTHKRELIFEGTGVHAGLEVNGDLERLLDL